MSYVPEALSNETALIFANHLSKILDTTELKMNLEIAIEMLTAYSSLLNVVTLN